MTTDKKAESHIDETVKENQANVPVDAHQESLVHEDEKKGAAKGKKIKIAEQEYAALLEKVTEAESAKEVFVRKVADFENAKKRLVKEKEDFARFANEKIIGSFLPVLDNLERAIAHTDKPATVESLLSGFELIQKQIFGVLKDNGVTQIESVGNQFDPHFHEAIGMIETDDHPAGSVVEEVQRGYMLKDRLLRPSWVRVAEEKNPSEENGQVSEAAGEAAPTDGVGE